MQTQRIAILNEMQGEQHRRELRKRKLSVATKFSLLLHDNHHLFSNVSNSNFHEVWHYSLQILHFNVEREGESRQEGLRVSERK